jgi:hypothetical protein
VSGIDVFLSYSREDRAAARHIADSFAAEGINVWWDAALQSGQTFDEVIEERLKEAKAVVVLWSPRSAASRWVRAEATIADRQNKLVPAIIEICDRPIAFELTHTADLSEWTGDTSDVCWRTFVGDVRRLVDREISPAAVVAPTKPNRSPAGGLSRFRDPPIPKLANAASGNNDIIFNPKVGADSSAADAQEEIHCLKLITGEKGEELFVVGSSGLKIGRSAPADIVIPDSSVSRQHCLVGVANDELLVTDLNSTNGTFVDGQRISRPTIVPVGAVLQVGQVSVTHEVRTRAEASQPGKRANSNLAATGFRPARAASAP